MSSAIDRYIANMEAIREALGTLQEYADDFGGVSPDDVNWANVADVARIASSLNEIIQFVEPNKDETEHE